MPAGMSKTRSRASNCDTFTIARDRLKSGYRLSGSACNSRRRDTIFRARRRMFAGTVDGDGSPAACGCVSSVGAGVSPLGRLGARLPQQRLALAPSMPESRSHLRRIRGLQAQVVSGSSPPPNLPQRWAGAIIPGRGELLPVKRALASGHTLRPMTYIAWFAISEVGCAVVAGALPAGPMVGSRARLNRRN
jgi:hypothetical protein